MTFALPKKTCTLWQMRTSFVIVALYAAIVVFCRKFPKVLLPTTIVMAIGSVFVLLYISKYLKSYVISADKTGISITKGVFLKTIVLIPHPKLAFVRCFTTPITSHMNLRCIVLKIARGWLLLPEIESSQAKSLIKVVQNG